MTGRLLLALALLVTIFSTTTMTAADGPKTGVITIDQFGRPVLDVCYSAVPAVPARDSPLVAACDGDDGAQDGTVVLSGVPIDIPYLASISTTPSTCSDAADIEFIQADATELTVQVLCLSANGEMPDFAAITLLPGDVGETGWVHDGAFAEGLESQARAQAGYLGNGTSESEVFAKLLSIGWQRYYMNSLILPSQQNASVASSRIRSYLTEYTTAEGAAEGFVYLEDESLISGSSDIATTRTFGDRSEITTSRGISSVDGRPYQSIDLTFQVGNLVAGVTLIHYGSESDAAPTVEQVETLAAMLLSRIADHLTDGPDLGNAISRIGPHDYPIAIYDDAYYRLNGQDVSLSGESSNASIQRTATYGNAADVYQFWEGVDVGHARGALFGVTVLHFESVADAGRWITDLPMTLESNSFYGNIETIVQAPILGEESTAISYTSGTSSSDAPKSMLMAVRIGSDVIRVHLVPQGLSADATLATIVDLAEIESRCLTHRTCFQIGTLPVSLLAYLDGTSS